MTASIPLRAAAALVVATVALSAPTAAQGQGSVYTVRGVSVDQTGASAAAARDVALAAGQAKAFQTLVRRLVPVGEQSRAAVPEPARLADLVLGFEVENEKTSRVRYLATLTVRFSPGAVRNYLRDSGVRFAETRSKPILVLPVYRGPVGIMLWQHDNPWRMAWAEIGNVAGLIPVIVPPGNAEDAAMLGAEQALAADQARMAAMALRYGAADTLLVAATLVSGDGQPPALEVTVSRFGTRGTDITTVRSFVGAPGVTSETVLKGAARQVLEEIEEGWKRDNLLRFDERREMIVHAPLTSLPQWVGLRARLDRAAAVQATTLIALSRDRATIRLTYLGDERQLSTELAQSDLELRRGPVDWEIRLRGARGTAAAPKTTPPAAPSASPAGSASGGQGPAR